MNDRNDHHNYQSSGRVAGRHHCLPAPSEPYRLVSSHTAQALVNASARIRACLMGLEFNLCVTAAEPATENAIGGGSRTSGGPCDRADISAPLPTPVG